MRNLINMTAHVIKIMRSDGTILEVPPSGKVARVKIKYRHSVKISGIWINVPLVRFENIHFILQNPHYNYIVSTYYLQMYKKNGGRKPYNMFCPGKQIKDDAGNIIACSGLVR